MENPFQNSNIETLKEAFPTVDVSIINDVLYSAQGDLNVAFDMLLDMNSSAINGIRTKPLPNAPPLPLRQSSSINNIVNLVLLEKRKCNTYYPSILVSF